MEAHPPVDGDRDQGPKILAITWTLSAVALVMYALRLWTRARLKHNTSLDDAVTGVSLILLTTAAALLSAAVPYGFGRHPYYLEPKAFEKAVQLLIVFESPCIMAFSFPKLAVAMALIQLSPPNKRRALFLYGLTLSQLLSTIIAIILLFTSCSSVQALWNPAVAANAKCRPPSTLADYTIFHGSYSAFVDLVLAGFPVLIFWNLQVAPKVKFGLCALMGLTVFSSICAMIKSTYFKAAFEHQDIYTWSSVPLNLWSLAEAAVIITAVSVPHVRPLVHSLRHIWARKSGYKQNIDDGQHHDDQNPLRAGQSRGIQQGYTVSAWNATHPSEENRSFIELPDRVVKATDFRVHYEEGKQNEGSVTPGRTRAF